MDKDNADINSSKEFNSLDHAWQIYLNTQDIIKYADQKVHVLIVLGTIITGAVLTQMDTLLRELFLNRLLIFSFFYFYWGIPDNCPFSLACQV